MNEIEKCKICGAEAIIQFDEFGMLYRIACPKEHIYTEDKLSPSSTLEHPKLDKAVLHKLIEEWNSLNARTEKSDARSPEGSDHRK